MKVTDFKKPPYSLDNQLELLRSRGLIIQDIDTAKHYLKFISYYRFCGYGIPYEENFRGEKRYRKGTTFEQILECYVFDRKLRILVIDAIERIEVAIRTVMVNELALEYGAHWYLESKLFLKKFKHYEFIETIKKDTFYWQDTNTSFRKRERFIQHYYEKYAFPALPAIWMVAEILPLGTWSLLFRHLANRDDQKQIAKNFTLDPKILGSWLHSLTYLRNLCAHHSSLWNRTFTLKPMIAQTYRAQLENNNRFAAQAAIIKIFLDVISPHSHWVKNLISLIAKHPEIDVLKMGFQKNWLGDPFWQPFLPLKIDLDLVY